MLLNKAQIFACEDTVTKIVAMPEWGGDVKIRAMTIGDQIEFERLNKKSKDPSSIVCNTLLFCCIDEAGNRLFNEDDIKVLEKKSFRAVEKLFRACLDLNSLNADSLEKEAKNS